MKINLIIVQVPSRLVDVWNMVLPLTEAKWLGEDVIRNLEKSIPEDNKMVALQCGV